MKELQKVFKLNERRNKCKQQKKIILTEQMELHIIKMQKYRKKESKKKKEIAKKT